jgi:hypothetical protein
MNNGVWFEGMANLPLPASADFAAIAKGSGFPAVSSFDDIVAWEDHVPALLESDELSFAELKIEPVQNGLWEHDAPQPDLPELQFTRMGDELRRLSSTLTEGS